MTPPQDPFYAGLGQAVRIGTELLAALIVGGGLGWLADTYLLGGGFAGVVIGLFVGVAAGILNVMRAARRWSA
jgi:ATP synthase protein I